MNLTTFICPECHLEVAVCDPRALLTCAHEGRKDNCKPAVMKRFVDVPMVGKAS